MVFIFKIEYNTVYGQDLVLNIIDRNGNGDKAVSEYRMRTYDGFHWECEVNCALKTGTTIEYYYTVVRGDVCERREWNVINHQLELCASKAMRYVVYDHWFDIPDDAYLYTSAITDCIVGNEIERPESSNYSKTVRLKVRAPQLRKGEKLVIAGSEPCMGEWDIASALHMKQHSINEWIVDIDATRFVSDAIEFKFAAISNRNGGEVRWESSDNRTVELVNVTDGEVVVYDLAQAYFGSNNLKCAGTLVPVFSLRSATSFGVGDFGDLKKMIDWVACVRQRVLQILPINDTTTTHTWTDSYPYSCISIFALHPQYADLSALPQIKDEALRHEMEELRKELNALPQIDYERVNDAKIRYLRIIFEQEGAAMMATDEYRKFFEENEEWLVPYARYCNLRDTNGTADFSKWEGHTTWDEQERKALTSSRTKLYKEAAFYYFVQYVLARQLKDAHDYARAHHVILKGDIPIGVNRYGCDVWSEPRYFNLNGQAGAPPDDFSVNGQNWGFPTYNWDEMIKDGCAWWVRRFSNMAKYFDAYRIDHVLGFFRIWEIPIHSVHGLLGQFSPALGMSRDEIEGYGLHWQEELFTEPFITDWVLDRMFGEQAGYVRNTFLEHKHDGFYRMKPEFDTQRKVEAWFLNEELRIKNEESNGNEERRTKNEESNTNMESNESTGLLDSSLFTLHSSLEDLQNLRDGLYALISDVLFVRDNRNADLFHPRISVQFDFIYESLYDSDKAIFNRLYNDYFYRRNNQFWYFEAMKKLPRLVDATRMLVCAEDLGMVPDCVAWVMNELRILSLELQSMPKDPTVRFGHLSRNPYRSVCTISSHDMPTLRQWWDEDWGRTQDYYNSMLYRGDAAPHPLPGWLARDIISRHLTSPSMLCILSIQDWLAIDESLRLANADAERINIPANPKHYWRYRMHVSIEDLMANNSFNENIKELISQSGRK